MLKACPESHPQSAAGPEEIARFRLTRHHLAESKPADAVTVARDVCGMQAQFMSAAFLQFWTRNHGIAQNAIERALWQERSLVRTSLMRQTLHLVPADQFSVYIAALRSSRVRAVLRIMARFRISRDEAEDLTGLILEALSSGPSSRVAIQAAVRPKVSKRVRAWMDKVWSIVRIPIAEGLICYSPSEGNEATFIRVDQWLGKQAPVAEQPARMELLRSYLRAYGPATLSDFAHWSGMSAGEVRTLPRLLAADLEEVETEKRVSLVLCRDVDLLQARHNNKGTDSIRLLPHFDPYLLAHRGKDHLVDSRHYKRVYRNQGWISPVLLINGRVAGVWTHKRQATNLTITIEPFGKLSPMVRRAIAREAEDLSRFFACNLELLIR